MNIKVSIHCITYNHAPFIKRALDSFVMQKTEFPYEVIVGDDCSTDGTTEIIKEYAEKYPDIIKPIFHEKNVGIHENYFDVSNACSGEYVAMCEGDDYWIDENKLQRQVDYLDAHPECSICFHPVKVVWDDQSKPDSFFPTKEYRFNQEISELSDLLEHNYIQTNSAMYRWRFHENEKVHDLISREFLPLDYFLSLLHAEKGKIGFLPDAMSVYVKHSGGVWSGVGEEEEWFVRHGFQHAIFYIAVQKHFHVDCSEKIDDCVLNSINAALKLKVFDGVNAFAAKYPEYCYRVIRFSESVIASYLKKFRKKYRKYRRLLFASLLCVLIEFVALIWLLSFS